MDDQVNQLRLETQSLKEEVASLNHQLEEEKDKMGEMLQQYVTENAEAEQEFLRYAR